MMDCKTSHGKCGACCCSMFPIEKDLFETNKEKIVNSPIAIQSYNSPQINSDWGENPYENIGPEMEHVLPITKNGKCCFLNKDLSCNIYENRPPVCRKFGDETCGYMTCCFQSKDGRIRSRQESRSISRSISKEHKDIEEKLKIITENFN